jgi:hypothetical protein
LKSIVDTPRALKRLFSWQLSDFFGSANKFTHAFCKCLRRGGD